MASSAGASVLASSAGASVLASSASLSKRFFPGALFLGCSFIIGLSTNPSLEINLLTLRVGFAPFDIQYFTLSASMTNLSLLSWSTMGL